MGLEVGVSSTPCSPLRLHLWDLASALAGDTVALRNVGEGLGPCG